MASTSFELRRIQKKLQEAEKRLRHAERSSFRVGERAVWDQRVRGLRAALAKESEVIRRR